MKGLTQSVLIRALCVLGGCEILAACSTVPIPPTYTQEELKAICQRHGGAWHDDDLMGGFCEKPRS